LAQASSIASAPSRLHSRVVSGAKTWGIIQAEAKD
jgi:hypothetical protein